MKSISTRSKTTLAIATAFVLSISAQAFPGGKQSHHGKYQAMTQEQREAMHEKRLNRMAKKLGLSQTQKAQIKAIKDQNKAQKQRLHTQRKQLRQQLRTQRENNAADANLEATYDQMYALKKQMRQIHRDERQQIDYVLTPEQREKIKEMHQKRMDKRKKHGKHGKHGGHR